MIGEISKWIRYYECASCGEIVKEPKYLCPSCKCMMLDEERFDSIAFKARAYEESEAELKDNNSLDD